MRAHPFVWVDAFTEVAYGGNPCSVVFDADDIPEADRLTYTRETRLSECAFVVASDRADFGARYYLASREIKMAGHPTVATVIALADRGLIAADARPFTLEVGAGVIEVSLTARAGRPPLVTMVQLAPVFGERVEREAVARLYGLSPDDVAGSPRAVSTGSQFCIALLRGHDALRRARLDLDRHAALPADSPLVHTFLAVRQGATEAGDTFARLLLAPPEPPEDPFTGAATGCLGAYLWSEGLIGRPVFVAEQGHWMGRPGRAEVEALGPPDSIAGVRVSGAGVVVMRGEALI